MRALGHYALTSFLWLCERATAVHFLRERTCFRDKGLQVGDAILKFIKQWFAADGEV